MVTIAQSDWQLGVRVEVNMRACVTTGWVGGFMGGWVNSWVGELMGGWVGVGCGVFPFISPLARSAHP